MLLDVTKKRSWDYSPNKFKQKRIFLLNSVDEKENEIDRKEENLSKKIME